MRHRLGLIAIIALLPAPALAVDERRLSAAEVERILDEATRKREAPAPAPSAKIAAPARPIEGEVGLSVGSDGHHELFGTVVVPVGAEAVAIISIGSAESRRRTLLKR